MTQQRPGIAWFPTAPYLLDEVWINGAYFLSSPVKAEAAPGLFVLPTQGGTHIVQRQYRGALKPLDYSALKFSFSIDARDEGNWYLLKKAKALGAPFYFSYGIRQVDTFSATSGQTYRLSRPLASGIVPGIDDTSNPTIVELNGSVSPSSATVTGQNVVAAVTGTITVTYTPAHLVVFSTFPEDIAGTNHAVVAVTLEEVLQS